MTNIFIMVVFGLIVSYFRWGKVRDRRASEERLASMRRGALVEVFNRWMLIIFYWWLWIISIMMVVADDHLLFDLIELPGWATKEEKSEPRQTQRQRSLLDTTVEQQKSSTKVLKGITCVENLHKSSSQLGQTGSRAINMQMGTG